MDFVSPVRFGAYADDIAAVIRNMHADLPKIMAIFDCAMKASALTLKKKKCVVVPLDVTFDEDHHRHKVLSACESLRGAPVQFWAKYLGAIIGPHGHLHRWKAQSVKLVERARWLKGQVGACASRLVSAYQVHAFSVMTFAAQFYPPSDAALLAERKALHIISPPRSIRGLSTLFVTLTLVE